MRQIFNKYFSLVILLALIVLYPKFSKAQSADLKRRMDSIAQAEEPKVIAWRRQIHQNPELGNREFKTSQLIADHLRSLGLDVQTGVGKTGVIGILKGGKPGPVIALRADMDALPITERTPVAFASKVTTEYNGAQTGVMHACGHDTHVAILMGTAEVAARVRNELAGTIKFIFQPAEEGAPIGEEGGAALMIKEGAMENPKVEAVFGLHINSKEEAGKLIYCPGAFMASADGFEIVVKGKSTHGASPWLGVDPVVTASLIIVQLQTIVSRMTPLAETPAVVTIGSIKSGNRNNIIPEQAIMTGTVRCFDTKVQMKIHEEIRRIVKNVSEGQGATAEVNIVEDGYPVTYNDPALTEKMIPSLVEAAGASNVALTQKRMGAEDFSFFEKKVPGLFFNLGGRPKSTKPEDAAPHHTPDFYIDESGLIVGVKAFCHIIVNYPVLK